MRRRVACKAAVGGDRGEDVVIQNSFYGPETQGAFTLHHLGNLILECGETLRGAKLAYRTLGTLNADKSNAVLVTTWFSGTGKVMQDVYVGAGACA